MVFGGVFIFFMYSVETLAKARQDLYEKMRKDETETVKAVTVDDDCLFQRFYLNQMTVINSKLLKLPHRVLACASLFFKRFYVVHSIMSYHPKYATLTCLFLASKVEENRLDAATICRMANKPEWDVEVRKIEIPLLDALDFRLNVEHPHIAALGWIEELEEVDAELKKKKETVYDAINQVMTTDAPLLFNASHIACACIVDQYTDKSVKEKAVGFFCEKAKDKEKVLSMLERISVYLEESKHPPKNTEVVGIEKKIVAWNKHQKKNKKKAKKEVSKRDLDKAEKKKKKDEEIARKNKRLVEGSPSAKDEGGDFMIKTNIKRQKTEPPN